MSEESLEDIAKQWEENVVGKRELVVATSDVEAISPSHLKLSKGEQLVVLEKRPRAWLLGRLEPGSEKLTGETGVAELGELRLLGSANEKMLSFHHKWAGRAPRKEDEEAENGEANAEGEEELREQAAALKQAVKKRMMLIEMREKRVEQREQALVSIARRLKEQQVALEEREAKLEEREERLRNAVSAATASASPIRPSGQGSRVRNPSRVSKVTTRGHDALLKEGYPPEFLQTMRSLTHTCVMRRRFRAMVVEMRGHESSAVVRLRNNALKEIYSSETKYVSMLETCVRVYLKRMQGEASHGARPYISRNAHADVFGTYDIIYELHQGIQMELSERLQQWPSVQKFGDLFLRMAPVLRLYSSYIRNFERAQSTLKKLRKNSAFVNICEQLRNEEADGLTLESFLILPVQRLPRYQLLLNELLKHTPPEHSDFDDLTLAQSTIVSICKDINGQKVMDENSQHIRHLIEADRIESLSDFITDLSFFIAEGKLRQLGSEDDQTAYTFYLFSDRLLRTQPKFTLSAKKTRYQIIECVPLQDTLAIVDMNDTAELTNAFELISGSLSNDEPQVRMGFVCETSEEKQEWIDSVANFSNLFATEESVVHWRMLRDSQPQARPDKTVAEKVIAVPLAIPRAAIRGFKGLRKSPRGDVSGFHSPKRPTSGDREEKPARLSKSSHAISTISKK